MINIFDISRARLKEIVKKNGMNSFISDQIYMWIYKKRKYKSDEWLNISKKNRALLSKLFFTDPGQPEKILGDKRDAQKLLLKLKDGFKIEAVIIREKNHYTFCLSSQVGCPLACKFCATGKMGYKRDLSMGEIVSQVLILRDAVGEYSGKLNLVFMGMGEPLLNYENLKRSLIQITDIDGIGISPRNITVSTSGILENLMLLENDFPNVKVSFSLNASSSEMRKELMPISRKEKLENLLAHFRKKERKHRITFEYVLIKGINDSIKDADNIFSMLNGISCKINIIPYNENDAITYMSPGAKTVDEFAEYLAKKNFTVMVRWSKGRDIKSACGQLAGEQE